MAKFCPECGTAANGGKFCAECGYRFPDATATATASPPAAMAAPAAAASVDGRWQPAAASATANAMRGSFNGSFVNGNGSNSPAPWQQTPTPTPGQVAQAAQFAQAAAPLAARASSSYTAQNASAYGRQPPVAVPVNGASAYPQGANGTNGADPLLYKSPYPAATPVAPAAVPPPAPEPVPAAAAGAEAQQVYEQCVQTMRASRGGNNEDGVKSFKQNCRLYGLKQMDVQAFYDSLVRELGPEATLVFVPDLARLVPDDDRRKELVEFNASKRPAAAPAYAAQPFLNRNSSSSSSQGSFRDRAGSQPGAAPGASKGILKGRYADHPNCDICNVAFDVTKRRHHCRHCGLSVCSSCSPLRLLIPQGMQVAGAKGYDPSTPQRVCIQCAPQLHQYQDQLVAQFAKANEDNLYQAQGRLVHVPFSNSLFKECQNAADIMGNFFRDDWGAAADRAIPVAFLQKAHGLAILTIIKAGFLVSGQIGTGLVVAKLPDGTWSAPSAIGLGGLSGGFEIGGEIVELMIILGSEGAVKVFHKPQANIGAGLDLAVGPYGRSAVAAAAVSASGLNANYSYSHSKGFYAGISLQGKIIAARSDLNRKFYGRDLQPGEILSGHIAPPNAARPLYEAIQHAMNGADDHRESVARRASIMGPCRLCNCPMFVAHTHQVWNKNCKTCKHVH